MQVPRSSREGTGAPANPSSHRHSARLSVASALTPGFIRTLPSASPAHEQGRQKKVLPACALQSTRSAGDDRVSPANRAARAKPPRTHPETPFRDWTFFNAGGRRSAAQFIVNTEISNSCSYGVKFIPRKEFLFWLEVEARAEAKHPLTLRGAGKVSGLPREMFWPYGVSPSLSALWRRECPTTRFDFERNSLRPRHRLVSFHPAYVHLGAR